MNDSVLNSDTGEAVAFSMDRLLSAVIDGKPLALPFESDAFVRFRLPMSQALTVGVLADRTSSTADSVVSALVDSALSDLLSYVPDSILDELELSLADRFYQSTGVASDIEL